MVTCGNTPNLGHEDGRGWRGVGFVAGMGRYFGRAAFRTGTSFVGIIYSASETRLGGVRARSD
jgi:hypothetical protein